MLDILFIAHQPNYALLAHRGIDLTAAKPDVVPQGALPSAVNLVGTPGKVVLSLEGGSHQSFSEAEMYLQGQALAWQIVHNSDGVSSYYEALMRGLAQCKSPLVAVIPAWIEVVDKLWVQRMIWSMSKDRTCLLCGTYPEQGAAKDLAPHVVTRRIWPGGEFFVARRKELEENLRLCIEPTDMYEQLAQSACANGWRLWAHPGVRFKVLKHQLHVRKKIGQKIGTTANSDS